MKNQIKKIAREKLGMETIETRKSDGLDFYDLSVWQIREALEAAFIAGQNAASNTNTTYDRKGRKIRVSIPE